MSWDSIVDRVTRLWAGCEKIWFNVWQWKEILFCSKASRLALGFTAVSFPI
jgi:hypothetical protein